MVKIDTSYCLDFACFVVDQPGVPWRVDEPDGLQTFRMGLFGLDKMGNISETVQVMEDALDAVLLECGHVFPERSKAA